MQEHHITSQTFAQDQGVILTLEQVRTLLDARADEPQYRDLHDAVRIMQRSGIRPAELARLRWADFKFNLRVMRFEDRKTGIGHGTILDRRPSLSCSSVVIAPWTPSSL